MSFAVLSWLFVASVIVHNIEEAIWLPSWSQNAGRWHRAVAPKTFRFAVFVLTVLLVLVAVLAQKQGGGSVAMYLLCGYALAMLANVLVPHSITTIALNRYMPGTASAVACNLPSTVLLMQFALSHEYIESSIFIWVGPAVVLTIVALIPALFWVGDIIYKKQVT